uniref:Reverse transcriptase domain-containing protein n=1 Tax=Cannabis sativa TaxID=3483 RepID=A0A803P5L3_CANSA
MTEARLGQDADGNDVRTDFAHFLKANKQCNSNLRQEEVLFWKPSMVCYVLGVNPPLHVLEGFAKRVWQDKVDRVKVLSYGIFIIRFHFIEYRDQVINGGYVFFNRRPVIMKPWDPNVNFKKEDVKCVPIWVQLEDLELKYWAQKSLFKIVGQLGKPLVEDSITRERERLNYPRVLVEVIMDQQLPDILEFENEYGMNTSVGVKYEGKPISCSHCSGIGHLAAEWKKIDKPEQTQEFPAVSTSNPFQALSLEKQMGNRGEIGMSILQADREIMDDTRGEILSFKWIKCFVGMVKAPKLEALYSNVFDGWCFSSNIAWHPGGKITIAWNPHRFFVDIVKCTSQLMHLRMSTIEGFNSFLTVVYASNNRTERHILWKHLCGLYTDEYWCVMGDLNDILAKEERVGQRVRTYPDSEFLSCVNFCKLEDVKASGNFFTWSNKQPGADRIYSKIDRVMANQAWINKIWKSHSKYETELKAVWSLNISGGKMFQVVCKLKKFKERLKVINREGFCDLLKQLTNAKAELEALQVSLQQQPLAAHLHQQEKEAREKVIQKQQNYTSFLKQKAKMDWLQDGDMNSALFHACIKHRLRQNRILSIENQQGCRITDSSLISDAFLDFYKNLLGTKRSNRKKVERNVINKGPLVSSDQAECLLKEFTEDDIKKAVFSIPGNKSPGPDGFSSSFYQDNWEIIGSEICGAVKSFLESGNILKEINSTIVTLVPKSKCPNSVKDFRPIACCNVIYKIATKLLSSRINDILPSIISQSQGGFIKGRLIGHNILICQDLVRHYGRKAVKPSCMIKLDLQKAYDTIEWSFLEEMLYGLNFPERFILLVMNCISTPKFSLMFNGSLHGFFEAKRGIRQGDPISPLLFVLGMEYLSRLMKEVGEKEGFKFHDRCSALKLNHLAFADDVLSFCHGDFMSILYMLQALKTFSLTSGLYPNPSKTAIYCSNMQPREVSSIMRLSGFTKQEFPFTYLGIPICGKRISGKECEILAERMTTRIRSWSTRNLSFAGRITLINSVLIAIQAYWSQMMILPKKVLRIIESICRDFLWKGNAMYQGAGSVAWNNICQPKAAGGLGIKNLEVWNKAAICKYIWAVANKQESLWLRWIQSVYIKNQDWWDYTSSIHSSWYWKKLVALKEQLRTVIEPAEFQKKKYTISAGYNLLLPPTNRVNWSKEIGRGSTLQNTMS